MHLHYTNADLDCGTLSNPLNGNVTFTTTTVGSGANYSCDAGFVLMGLSSRVCVVNGSWSGEAPVCRGELKVLNFAFKTFVDFEFAIIACTVLINPHAYSQK